MLYGLLVGRRKPAWPARGAVCASLLPSAPSDDRLALQTDMLRSRPASERVVVAECGRRLPMAAAEFKGARVWRHEHMRCAMQREGAHERRTSALAPPAMQSNIDA